MSKFWIVVCDKRLAPVSFIRHQTEEDAKNEADERIKQSAADEKLLILEAVLSAEKSHIQWTILVDVLF